MIGYMSAALCTLSLEFTVKKIGTIDIIYILFSLIDKTIRNSVPLYLHPLQ